MDRAIVQVTDLQAAQGCEGKAQLGALFVYVTDPAALPDGPDAGRDARLHLSAPSAGGRVLPLVGEPVQLKGIRVNPVTMQGHRLGAIVCDRDLYRAEQDTVHLFIAVPGASGEVSLTVTCNGQPFAGRTVTLEDGGVAVETLSMLLPGSYTASLRRDGSVVGQEVSFTVAEYSLAPLSARLLRTELDAKAERLTFALEVESYQVPFDGRLTVELLDGERAVESAVLAAAGPGRYEGALSARGEGPFRLRLSVKGDERRVAEVAIPGSRKAEREETRISELGAEVSLSLMAGPEALSLRGGWLSRGAVANTPVVVDEVVAATGQLRFLTAAEDAALVLWEPHRGRLQARRLGPVAAGATVDVPVDGPLTTVFVGALLNGRPFEGFTTFVPPPTLELEVDAPATSRPGEVVEITLRAPGSGAHGGEALPVLLTVRDRRLTATDLPEVALAGSLKAGVAAVTKRLGPGFHFEQVYTPPPIPTFPPYGPMFGSIPVPSAPPPGALQAMDMASSPLGGRGARGRVDLSYAAPPTMARPAPAMREAPMKKMRRLSEGDYDGEAEGAAPDAGGGGEGAPARDTFPEQLYYGLLRVAGEVKIPVALGDTLGTFVVEAFALGAADWARLERTLTVTQPLRVDLDLPASIHPEDACQGHLRAACDGGKVRVRLTRDGAPVPLGPGREAAPLLESPADLPFPAGPGRWVATAEDPSTGEVDRIQVDVDVPGKLRYEQRAVRFLRAGEAIDAHGDGVLGLRVLPGLSKTFMGMVVATAGYEHLCCEQTAAKILSAATMYLMGDVTQRPQAEAILLAGIAREQKMFRPGQGFLMYPGGDYHSTHYSSMAARYLFKLDALGALEGISSPLSQAVRDGLAMARDAAAFHGIDLAPKHLRSVDDALTAAGDKARWAEVDRYLPEVVDVAGAEARGVGDAVGRRRILATAAAALLRMDRVHDGLHLTNAVLRDIGPQGRLYSTVDSAAAIGLMVQLLRLGIVGDGARLKVDGAPMGSAEAAAQGDGISVVAVEEGVAAVEITRLVEEDWGAWHGQVPLKVSVLAEGGGKARKPRPGDRLSLKVELPQGYRNGDLVHVDLPPGLAWVKGGGRVKRFTVDLAGASALDVPLVAIEELSRAQHLAVCLRNMFEEERAGSPGIVKVGGGWLSFLS